MRDDYFGGDVMFVPPGILPDDRGLAVLECTHADES